MLFAEVFSHKLDKDMEPNGLKGLIDVFKKMKEEHALDELQNFNSKTLIVDSLNQYMRAFAATPSMDDDGEHIGGMTGFLRLLGSAIQTIRPTRVICVFDGKGGSQRRREIYSEYKGQRRHMTKLNRTYGFESIEAEKKSQKWQLLALVHMLECLPVTVLAIDNIEADDAIAYIAKLQAERDGHAVIMSTDRDFLQLVTKKITVYNPVKKKIYDESTVVEEYQIHPSNFLIYRTVDGDKSDNIPGIKGIGPATLVKNFPQLADPAPVDIDSLIQCAKDNPKSKLCQKLTESRELLERNASLMRLDDLDISGLTRMKMLDIVDGHVPSLDKFKLTRLFTDYKIFGAFKNYDEWVLNNFAPLARFASR